MSPTDTRLLAELAQPNTLGFGTHFGTHFGDQPFGRVGPNARWLAVPSTAPVPPPRSV